MTTKKSLMFQEVSETPERFRVHAAAHANLYFNLAKQIRAFSPEYVYIVGRGTSDHAGVYAKYLIEVELGIPVSSAAPSVASIFGKSLDLKRALVIIISQSGRSPDVLAQAKAAKASGALCVALVNDEASPLADIADVFIPLLAGPEKAVAATKTYLCTLFSILHIVAHWKNDEKLLSLMTTLPTLMAQAQASKPQLHLDVLQNLRHCVVLGRGFGYAIAREISLKIKEICAIQAEAFSSAEFLHGPISLLNKQMTIIDISVVDESIVAHSEQIDEIKARGGKVCTLSFFDADTSPRFLPLLIMQRFYLDIEHIAQQMGCDPDNPVGLNKVTQTR